MSWDLFVQDWGGSDLLSEIPDDFEPKSIGRRSDVMAKIQAAEPLVIFNDLGWGIIETDQFSIEFNLGSDVDLQSFAIHIRGNELAIPCIVKILEKLEMKASDGSSDVFFNGSLAKQQMMAWTMYREQILKSKKNNTDT